MATARISSAERGTRVMGSIASARISRFSICGLLGSQSRSMIPRRAGSVGDGPGRWRRVDRCPRPRTSPSRVLRSAHTNARDGSTFERELALRPGFSARARLPPTARPVTRREAGVTGFDCGGRCRAPTGVTPPARWPRANLIDRAGVLALFLTRGPDRGREGLKIMTRTEHNRAARRRGEPTRDRGSRRVSSAIDARRRLDARRADGRRTTADPVVPSDPRYAYPTRSYD